MPVISRRQFLAQSTAAVAAAGLPAVTRAVDANSKLRTVHIGVGGKGRSDLSSISSYPAVEVAGLCDVDAGRLAEAHKLHSKAKTFVDFREMLSELGQTVDAVVVSTPDHTHAPAAMMAMNAGKPVYCQKPLTHEVFEARRLREVSEEKDLVTQMGTQAHSSAQYRQAVQMIQDGVIGKVSQVHAWSHKNWGYDGGTLTPEQSPPDSVAWNLWLGTAAERPFVPKVYHPGQWRKLVDFGTGTLGDMGVHIFDTPYGALKLTAPIWARTTCRPPTGIGHPEQNVVEYEFPQTPYTSGALRWTWYDGGAGPPSPEELGLSAETELPKQGSLFIGEGGQMLLPHVGEALLYPQEKFADYRRPEVEGADHYHQWVDACLGKGEASASFSYGGPLTEALLLGVVANRFPGQKLMWNADQFEVTNIPEANTLLKRNYRDGFEVPGLS